jgi:hypothetical protein
MNIFSIWQEALYAAWTDLITRLLLFLPVFLSSILVFAVGLMIAGWLASLVLKLLRTVRFSQLTTSAGLDKFLKKADFGYDTAELISQGVKWLTILIFFMASTNILGLTAISGVLNSLIAYVPRVLTATLIIALGAFFARLAEGVVRGTLATVDHTHSKPLSQVARWAIMIVAILTGVKELRIAETLIETFFQGLTWTVTLAVGLAVGLGAKDVVSSMLKDWYDKLKK